MQMLEILSTSFDTGLKPITPLVNGLINDLIAAFQSMGYQVLL